MYRIWQESRDEEMLVVPISLHFRGFVSGFNRPISAATEREKWQSRMVKRGVGHSMSVSSYAVMPSAITLARQWQH
jgi:hypothetical protein